MPNLWKLDNIHKNISGTYRIFLSPSLPFCICPYLFFSSLSLILSRSLSPSYLCMDCLFLYSAVWCISLFFIVVYESWNVGEEHLRDFLDLTSHGMVSNGLHLNMLFVVCTHFLHQYSLSSCMCLHSYK